VPHFRRRRQRKRYLLVKVRLFVFAAPTIKSSLKSVVGLVVNLLGVAIYLKDMAFGAALMIVGLVVNLLGVAIYLKDMAFGAALMIVGFVVDRLGVAIYLKDMAFGAALMIVGFVIDRLGVAFHDLRLALEFRLS
jgi:hypothetical protein